VAAAIRMRPSCDESAASIRDVDLFAAEPGVDGLSVGEPRNTRLTALTTTVAYRPAPTKDEHS
jgi:hypothetical protein